MADTSAANRFVPSPVDDRQYRLFVESVSDYAIYILDPDGVVASWNAGAERFKGYSAADIIGCNFAVFYTLEDQANGEPRRALDTAMREGHFESEGWRIRNDGSRFWASVVVDPIREGDHLIGFAKITRDISERKAAEQTLIQTNATLLQSQKMEAIGQLTGGIAHDFNNLLAAVLGSLELLRGRLPADPKLMRLLDNAVQGAERGTALTQRMLAFARQQDIAPEPVDLPVLVRGMTTLMQPALGPGIILQIDMPFHLNAVLVDPNQLEMALLNLAVNARDAMPGGGTIIINVREARLALGEINGLAAGQYACLSVQDFGMGMNEATLSRSVEPFYTTKSPGQGTGLGLAMVHGMAIQAGGRLILESEVGRGTVARIWLPMLEAAAVVVSDEPGGASEVPRSVHAVVLAVDDDILVLFNTVMMLEDLGHHVFQAASGKEALEILGREPAIELVITDMAMPRMSGLELMEAALKLHPALRFVLATGYSEAPNDDELMPLRLAKPFWQRDLAKAVNATLGKYPSDRRVVQFPRAA